MYSTQGLCSHTPSHVGVPRVTAYLFEWYLVKHPPEASVTGINILVEPCECLIHIAQPAVNPCDVRAIGCLPRVFRLQFIDHSQGICSPLGDCIAVSEIA